MLTKCQIPVCAGEGVHASVCVNVHINMILWESIHVYADVHTCQLMCTEARGQSL